MYRFTVANDQLFAIPNRGSYGSESGVLSTHDEGGTWFDFRAPQKTYALCGNGTDLFALTSRAEVWRKRNGRSPWKLVWTSPSQRWTYDIDIAADGTLYVTASDGIIVMSDEGKVVREYGADGEDIFGRCFFADDYNLVVQCNPFKVAILDTTSQPASSVE